MGERRRTVLLAVATFVVALPLAAEAKTVIDWASTQPLTGSVADGELLVEVSGPGVYPLLLIEDPGVEPPRFQVDGTVRHEAVAGTAYFEMWTVLPDESRFFTRTLAETGSMGYMTGDSEQRPFTLPFELGEGGPVPIRLEINLVTEGAGRFWVGPLTIASAAETTSTPTTQAPTTSLAEPAATTTLADQEEAGGVGLWWGLGALVVVGATAFGWLRTSRKKRAEEQRRMNAMDSLRS